MKTIHPQVGINYQVSLMRITPTEFKIRKIGLNLLTTNNLMTLVLL